MIACLNLAGKLPVVNDLLHNEATNSKSKQLTSFTSYVGAGSRWHVLLGAELINFSISSTVTAVKSAISDVARSGTSYSRN